MKETSPIMSGFKEPSFAERQKAAQQARQNMLDKFRSQPGLDDPAVKQRQAEREARAAERSKARLARTAARRSASPAPRSAAGQDWPARPQRPSRNAARPRRRRRPQPSSRAKRKK